MRTDRHGRRQERVLPTGWLNAVMEEPAGKVPRLLLVARGVREEIATTLGEVEKRDLCGGAARRRFTGCAIQPSTIRSCARAT